MSNKTAGANSPNTLDAWFSQPGPQYVPLADVGFAPPQPVMPAPLPPSSYVFSNPVWNKMLNLPSIQTVYERRRTGTAF